MTGHADGAPTALILGAGGQDGTLLSGHLLHAGAIVHATGRTTAFAATPGWAERAGNARLHLHALNPEDADAVRALVAATAPDQIFCLTGQSSVGRSFAEPAQTMRSHLLPIINVAEAVRQLRSRAHIVVAGSGDIFGETSTANPAREDSPIRPASPYGVAKAAAVMAARNWRDSYDLRISIAHLFGHESAARSEQFVFGKVVAAIRAIRSGRAQTLRLGRGDIIRDWGWAADYVAAMAAMAQCDDPVELILATGHSVTLADAVAAIFAASGLDSADHVEWNCADLIRSGEIACMAADPARATTVIGWSGSTGFPHLAALLISGTGD